MDQQIGEQKWHLLVLISKLFEENGDGDFRSEH